MGLKFLKKLSRPKSRDRILNTIDHGHRDFWMLQRSSPGTLQRYTHYELTLPNENTQFKLSGNYMISVFDSSRKKQGELIAEKTQILQQLNLDLITQKRKKEVLVQENKGAQDAYRKEQTSQQALVKALKKKERSFVSQIKNKQVNVVTPPRDNRSTKSILLNFCVLIS